MKNILKKIIIYLLKFEAKLVLMKYKPKIIAITGSVGKTSTKDAVFTVMSEFVHIRKSEKSFNSEIGLPLTILGLPNGWSSPQLWLQNIFKGLWLILWPHKYPEWLVLEVGVGKRGDMKETASWLHSDVVIITTIGITPAHIEFFNSRKELIEEKSGLIKTLKKDGLLVLNADDEAVVSMKPKTKNRTVNYGFSQDADYVASSDQILYAEEKDENKKSPMGVTFKVDENGRSLPVVIKGVFGRNHIYASLASLAMIGGLKFDMLKAIDSLKDYNAPPGRMRLLSGINNSFIIDDTYNSSPFACQTALETLNKVDIEGRKIAILGDMMELGKHTEEAHYDIGKIAKENCSVLYVVGPRAQSIKKGALDAGMDEGSILEFTNSYEAADHIKDFINKGDLILIKGSQIMRMERVTEVVLLDKTHKKDLLVRQDQEWLSKD